MSRSQFEDVAAQLGLAPRIVDGEPEPYRLFRSRIRDRYGIVITEEVLHQAIGSNPEVALHRARVEFDRRVAAIETRKRWLSEPVMTVDRRYPPLGQTDAEDNKVVEDSAWATDPRVTLARQVAQEYGEI